MNRRDGYTVTYVAESMGGEDGFRYDIIRRGKLLRSGWSRGSRRHAERMAAADLRQLERSAA